MNCDCVAGRRERLNERSPPICAAVVVVVVPPSERASERLCCRLLSFPSKVSLSRVLGGVPHIAAAIQSIKAKKWGFVSGVFGGSFSGGWFVRVRAGARRARERERERRATPKQRQRRPLSQPKTEASQGHHASASPACAAAIRRFSSCTIATRRFHSTYWHFS
jgi:hypothetical protein